MAFAPSSDSLVKLTLVEMLEFSDSWRSKVEKIKKTFGFQKHPRLCVKRFSCYTVKIKTSQFIR